MGTPLVKVSYKNVSGSDVPPYGIVQLTGSPIVTGTNDYVLQATTPGSGTGPYMIDTGKGTKTSGAKQLGSCTRAIDGLAWVSYGCGSGPPTPWCNVGPVRGSFYANESGSGYRYAGQYDSANHRILVMMDSFTTVLGTCSLGSSSSASASSSSRSSGSSGSSSSSSPCGAITVVTNVTCSGGSLVVTYGEAAASCPGKYVYTNTRYLDYIINQYIDLLP